MYLSFDPENVNPSRMGPNVTLFIKKGSMQIDMSNCIRSYCLVPHI